MKFWKIATSILPGLLIFGCMGASSEKTDRINTVKVLGIGNSFLWNATLYRKELNKENPANQLLVKPAGIGGSSLKKHWSLVEKHEKDPTDPAGKPYRLNGKKASLKDMLKADKWNYVTIQQLSGLSDIPKSYIPYASNLYNYIKKYCPSAEIIVYETWADRADNKRLKRKNKSQKQMYKDLSSAYRFIAAKLDNLKIIPVGDAFHDVRKVWKFKPIPDFNPQKFKHPELPDQRRTLCIGWMWKKNKKTKEYKIRYDHHANNCGKLLAALVWREFFLGTDSRKSNFLPKSVNSEEAKVIRKAAHDAVIRNPSVGK